MIKRFWTIAIAVSNHTLNIFLGLCLILQCIVSFAAPATSMLGITLILPIGNTDAL